MNNYPLTEVTAFCPVCFEQKALLLYQVDSREAAQHFVLKEKDEAEFSALQMQIEKLWKNTVCKVLRCSNCSFSYAYPYVAGDSQFYSLAYKRESYPEWKWEYEVSYRVLERLLENNQQKNIKLLEIGAGNGAFVRRISTRLIPRANILCTEFSDYGAGEIRRYGIDCRAVDVKEIDRAKYANYFGLVCLFQTLEHMDELDSLFTQLNLLTGSDADMFIAVPNDKNIELNENNEALLDMPPNHIGRWNRKAFEIICARHGWQIMEHKIEGGNFLPALKKFSVYRYLRESQRSGTVCNRVETIKNRLLHRCLQIPIVGFKAVAAIPLLRKIGASALGDSQWIWLRKVRTL